MKSIWPKINKENVMVGLISMAGVVTLVVILRDSDYLGVILAIAAYAVIIVHVASLSKSPKLVSSAIGCFSGVAVGIVVLGLFFR